MANYKIVDVEQLDANLKSIADSIREKSGTTDLIPFTNMPQAILDIVSGGGIKYTDIIYNEDNTITLIDTKDQEHTMICTYEDGKLIGITYDGKTVQLTYENDVFIGIGNTTVNIDNVICDNTIDNLETLIDESGVLDSTEGTVSIMEKVEQLIDKADELDVFQSVTAITFDKTTFPSKERVRINLPNVSNLDAKFSSWNNEPIPKVDELILTAPKAKSIGMLFYYCSTFKKVVLTLSNDIANMRYAFGPSNSIEEITLYFSTENVTNFNNCFGNTPIKTIEGTLDFSSATDVVNMFSSCGSLEEVTFAPNTLSISISLAQSSKLTNKTKQSIFDGLAYVQTAQTITFHKDVKILQSQVDSANAKGWTVAGGTVVSEEEYYG